MDDLQHWQTIPPEVIQNLHAYKDKLITTAQAIAVISELPVYQMRKDVQEIKATTSKSANILRSIASIFKFGGKEMERH